MLSMVVVIVLPVKLGDPHGQSELAVDPVQGVLCLSKVNGVGAQVGLESHTTDWSASVQQVLDLGNVAERELNVAA